MNDNNLKPFNAVAARENGYKGGVASGKARQERKKMKEHLIDLLSSGNIQENILLAILDKAQNGDIKAAEFIRDTIGEKPSDKRDFSDFDVTQLVINAIDNNEGVQDE
ncbi:MAG: hypothetical protein IKN71_04145 [Alphaproteobacteria bacterium]|nr:hypothetical protein [Alphaproteobacteria bacterium]